MGARSHFMDAVSMEADCAEAIYNLGLVSKALGNLDDALTAFKKMNSMLTDDTAVMFQVSLLMCAYSPGVRHTLWHQQRYELVVHVSN